MNIFSTSITLPQLFLATFLIAMVIGIVILAAYFLKKIKPRTRSATPATPATPAAPATPSGGWKSWTVIIVILAIIVIAGYLLVANWATVEGYLPVNGERATIEGPPCLDGKFKNGTWEFVCYVNGGIDFSAKDITNGQTITISTFGEMVLKNEGREITVDPDGGGSTAGVLAIDTSTANIPIGAFLIKLRNQETLTGDWLTPGSYAKISVANSVASVTDKNEKVLKTVPISGETHLILGVNFNERVTAQKKFKTIITIKE